MTLVSILALSGCNSIGSENHNGKTYEDDPNWSHGDDDDSTPELGDDDTSNPADDDSDPGDDDSADGTGGNTEDLQLPFPEGEIWKLTRGYNEGSHADYGYDWFDDRYAMDFAEAECDSWRKPIRPVRSGTIEIEDYDEDGYGNYVLIDHGDGYKSRYAHFDETMVVSGEWVTTNTVIGLCGNSGNVVGTACPDHPGTHLHIAYYLSGNAAIPEPMSEHIGMTSGCWYGHHGWIDCDNDDLPDDPIGDDDDLTDDDDLGDDDDLSDDDSDPGDDDVGDDDATSDDDDVADDDDATPDCLDADNDGYGIGVDCLGSDCDDNDNSIHPGATEVQCDSIDQDCGGSDWCPQPPGCDWTVPLSVSTIQDAIDLATTGETVCVEAGDYHEDLVFQGEDITVQGVDGAENTHIYGVATGGYTYGIHWFNGETNAMVLEGFTIHGAGSTALFAEYAAPTLRNITLECWPSTYGVALFESPGAVLENVRIEECDYYGLTVYGSSSELVARNVIVANNGSAGLRAGDGASVNLTNTVFYSNSAMGVWLFEADGWVENSIIMDHDYYGIHLEDASYTLTSQYNTLDDHDWDNYGTNVTTNGTDQETNPEFSNPGSSDFTLQPGSPCVNAGNPTTAMNDANNTQNDQGAYGGPLSENWP